MHKKLVKLPQTGLVIDVDQVLMIGQMEPGKYVAFLRDSNQGGLMLAGDHAALVAELYRRGMLQDVEIPAQAYNQADQAEPTRQSVEGKVPAVEVAKA